MAWVYFTDYAVRLVYEAVTVKVVNTQHLALGQCQHLEAQRSNTSLSQTTAVKEVAQSGSINFPPQSLNSLHKVSLEKASPMSYRWDFHLHPIFETQANMVRKNIQHVYLKLLKSFSPLFSVHPPPSLQLPQSVAVIGLCPVELVALGQQEALQVLVLGSLLQPLLLQHRDEHVAFLNCPHDLGQDLLLLLQLRSALLCIWRKGKGRKVRRSDLNSLPLHDIILKNRLQKSI